MADNASRAKLAAILSCGQVSVNGNGSSFLSTPTSSNRGAAGNSTAIAVMPLPWLPSTSMTNDAPCCASEGTAPTNAGPSRSNSDLIGNFRQLFAPYIRSTQPLRHLFPSRPKQKGSKLKGLYRTRETWTHDFMCLGKREQLKVPSQRGKMLLIDGGLGGMKISFDHNGNAEHVQERLEIYFPKDLKYFDLKYFDAEAPEHL